MVSYIVLVELPHLYEGDSQLITFEASTSTTISLALISHLRHHHLPPPTFATITIWRRWSLRMGLELSAGEEELAWGPTTQIARGLAELDERAKAQWI